MSSCRLLAISPEPEAKQRVEPMIYSTTDLFLLK